MPSNLQVVGEREIPEAQIEQPKMEKPSQPLSENSQSPETLALLMEIRKILNARAAAVMGLIGALVLTFLAMEQATWMALAMSAAYDILVFLPIAFIAYSQRTNQ